MALDFVFFIMVITFIIDEREGFVVFFKTVIACKFPILLNYPNLK